MPNKYEKAYDKIILNHYRAARAHKRIAEDMTILGQGINFGGFSGGGASGFVPSGSPIGWWDISAETAYSNNDVMATITDQSGNGKHLTQAGADTIKPVYKTNIQNGLAIAKFDGANDYIRNTNISQALPVSFFVVFRLVTPITNNGRICTLDAANSNVGVLAGLATPQTYFTNGSTLGIIALSANTWYIDYVSVAADGSGVWRRNGSQIASAAAGTKGPTGVSWGAQGQGTAPQNVEIGEMIYYSGIEATSDNEAGLATKWGITIA